MRATEDVVHREEWQEVREEQVRRQRVRVQRTREERRQRTGPVEQKEKKGQ